MKNPLRPSSGALLLPLLCLAVTSAHGQTAPSALSTPTPDAALKLSPFEVKTDKDTGYIAADTLSAGRLSTNLLKTPGDIDVLTRDLINDLGFMNIDQVSGFLTNSRPLETGAIEGNSMNPASVGGADSATNVSFRGLGAQPSTRNYFLSSLTPKDYNVERIEASRGPNAILYGEGGPGGQTNYITKQAKDHDATRILTRIDSEGSKELQLDINRVITDTLDIRYNGDVTHRNYYVSRDHEDDIGNALDVIWKPFDRTAINFAADYSINHRPIINIAYNDNYSLWNGVPVTAKLTSAQATAAGLSLVTGAHHNTYIDGLGMVDLAGTAITTGVAIPAITEYRFGIPNVQQPLDKDFNPNPAQQALEEHAADFQTTIDHSWANGFSAQLGAQYSKYRVKGGNYAFVGDYIDPNKFLPSGAANPEFGKMYSSSYLGHVTDGTERDNSTLRAVADYPLSISWLGTTNFSVFFQHQQANSRTVFSDYHVADPSSTLPITDATSEIYVYRYWDALPSALPDFSKTNNLVKVPTNDVQQKNRSDSFEAAGSGDYFHDTLSVVGGFRRDRSIFHSATGVAASRDATTGQFGSYTLDDRTGYNNTITIGAVYFPEKTVGLYVNHAEGFTVASVTAPELDGTYDHSNITPASDESFGLRFNFTPTSKITIEGSAGWYYTRQRNIPTPVGVGSINQFWVDHGMSSKIIQTFDPNPVDTAATNNITSFKNSVGWGWEGSVVVNVGNTFRFTLNGALPNTKQSDVAPDYVKYVTPYLAQFQAWAADPTNPNAKIETTDYNNITGNITGFADGRRQNLTYDYRVNALGVYTLDSTPLKGARFGAGYQYFGPSLIGNDIGFSYSYVYYRSYGVALAFIGYPVKIHKGVLDFQLNCDNLFNYDKQIFNGLFIYQAKNYPYGFKYNYPRTLRLQATYSF